MPEAATPSLTLGLDLGTSAVKAVVLGSDGELLGTASSAFDTHSAQPGQAEQDPAEWIRATAEACASLDGMVRATHPGWRHRVAGIGITGQLPTLVCLNHGRAIGPAITWKDTRADAWAAHAIDARQRRRLYERTGMPIDGRYLGPMFHFHHAAAADDVDMVLSAKDYLGYSLTGTLVTDPSTAAGYGAFDLAIAGFADDLLARWSLPASALPPVRMAHTLSGPLNTDGARLTGLKPGTLVTVGAADSVTSAFAMAGLEEGIVCVIMGSSTIIIDAIRERRLDPATRYLLTPHVEAGWYGREMDLLSTGTGYRWLSGLLGLRDGALDRYAATSIPGARGLTFAPYLAGGEQGALWDPTLRGLIRGLTLEHTAADIARAFLEGVCFEIRRCVSVLAEAAPVRGIVVAGHLVDQPGTLQLLSDILKQPVEAYAPLSPAAIGAANGARALLGAPTATASQQRMRVVPGPDSPLYESLYAGYLIASR